MKIKDGTNLNKRRKFKGTRPVVKNSFKKQKQMQSAGELCFSNHFKQNDIDPKYLLKITESSLEDESVLGLEPVLKTEVKKK